MPQVSGSESVEFAQEDKVEDTEEAGEESLGLDDIRVEPPARAPRFKVTFKRICDHGGIAGCASCDVFSSALPHTAKCRTRFQKRLS